MSDFHIVFGWHLCYTYLNVQIKQRVGGKVDERVDPLMMAQIGFDEWFNEGCIRAEEIMKDSDETEKQ